MVNSELKMIQINFKIKTIKIKNKMQQFKM